MCHAVLCLYVFLTSLVSYVWGERAADDEPPRCSPKGVLLLDKPYPFPSIASIGGLPFCSQFQGCTCCNASHVLTIQRRLSALEEDGAISAACLNALNTASCSVCDPEVGIGKRVPFCRAFCDEWWAACRDDYAAIQEASGGLQWCSSHQSATICSRVAELASSGAELCTLAGHDVQEVASGDPCFSGAPGPDSERHCLVADAWLAKQVPVNHGLENHSMLIAIVAALLAVFLLLQVVKHLSESPHGAVLSEAEVRERQQQAYDADLLSAAVPPDSPTAELRRRLAAGV